MRRKNLYLFEVDVYLTGLSLLDETILVLQSNLQISPTEAIIGSQKLPNLQGQPVAFVTCRFVRDVSLSSILDAFEITMAGLPQDDINQFRVQLSNAVGSNGVKKDDEVIYAWLNNGGMKIMLNGVVGGFVSNPLVEQRLIETYIDKKRTVSPQLVDSFHKNLPTISIK